MSRGGPPPAWLQSLDRSSEPLMHFQTHIHPPNPWNTAGQANAVHDWLASTAPPPFAAGPEVVRTPPTSFCSTPSSAYADENLFVRPDTVSHGVDDVLPPMPLYPPAQDVEANNYAPCRTATAGSMASPPPFGHYVFQESGSQTPRRLADTHYFQGSSTPAAFAAEGGPQRQPLRPKVDEGPLLWDSYSVYGQDAAGFHSVPPNPARMPRQPPSIYHQQEEALRGDDLSFGSPLTFAESQAGEGFYGSNGLAETSGRSVYEELGGFRQAPEPQRWQAFRSNPQEQVESGQTNVWASQM